MHKNTKPWATLENVSALYGAWVTGLIGNYGIWNDQWAWTYSSFGNADELPPYNKADQNVRKLPYTFFLRQWLWGISLGAAVCSTEDPLTFSREGRANSSFEKYLHPFIKGIGAASCHAFPPGRADEDPGDHRPVRQLHDLPGPWTYDPRTVFFTYLDEPTPFAPHSYDPFTVLFRNTYGFYEGYNGTSAAGKMFPKEPSLPDRLTRETIPNTARYYGLPILPHPAAKAPQGMTVVKLAELRTDAAIKRVFDTLYPADPYGSVAYAVEVDDSFFVINGNENLDRDQFFKMKLGDGVLNADGGQTPVSEHHVWQARGNRPLLVPDQRLPRRRRHARPALRMHSQAYRYHVHLREESCGGCRGREAGSHDDRRTMERANQIPSP